ncbi:MAG: YggS family pyridoxal phosphate-dependent enzyme [Pseudomonadota bacterium]
MIAENLAGIRRRVRDAALRSGRDPESIKIVAAAKGQEISKVREAVASGIGIIGDNYVREAQERKGLLSAPDVELHMIGHLQRNKAGKAVELFNVVQTVDDVRLAEDLSRRAGAVGRTLGAMIQVNIGAEPQKSGIAAAETTGLVESVRSLPHIRLLGLMTMPPFFDDPEAARPFFAGLREIRDRLISTGTLTSDMNQLSMGMTGEFEAAIEEGATLVRIGTALFGPR